LLERLHGGRGAIRRTRSGRGAISAGDVIHGPAIAPVGAMRSPVALTSDSDARWMGRVVVWKSMDSAPKDGTPILAKGRGPRDWAVAAWEPAHQAWACAWDDWPLEGFEPLHWQPLPEPPR